MCAIKMKYVTRENIQMQTQKGFDPAVKFETIMPRAKLFHVITSYALQPFIILYLPEISLKKL